MTGTAQTEEEEFREIYGMDVVVIPTNRPIPGAYTHLAIKAVFGDVEYVDSDLDEKAFVTAVITEGEFEACCNKIGVKSALRAVSYTHLSHQL